MQKFYVRKVAVLGAGVMGAQIAAHFANASVSVVLFDLKTNLVETSLKNLQKLNPKPFASNILSCNITSANYDDNLDLLHDCQLIIEAIAERIDWKEELYHKIAPYIHPKAIIASNTSGLSINTLASSLPKALQAQFCGIHFFNPPRYMSLVELIPHNSTADSLLISLEEFLVSSLGKEVVIARDTPNFIANRLGVFSMLLTAYHTQHFNLPLDLVDKLTGKELARAKSATYRTLDIVGIDVFSHVVKTMQDRCADGFEVFYNMPQWLQYLLDNKHLGQKTKAGCYKKDSEGLKVFNILTNEYDLASHKPSEAILEILKQKDWQIKFELLRNSELVEAQFLWACFRDLFHYAALMLGEIASNPRDMDIAIRSGFAWKYGIFELWQLAGWHKVASWINDDIINGKTIVKEWLFQLLREDFSIVRSPKSYNSQIGVPLSVWQIEQGNSLGIFEAGISQPDEMMQLGALIQPTIGVFTNIGSAHDENFDNADSKIREKLKLFIHTNKLIYCKDYAGLHEQITASTILPAACSLFTWSKRLKADLQIGRITKHEHETEIQGIYKNDFIGIRIPFSDEASIENAIHCWAVMLFLDIPNEVISQRMEFLSPVAMRLEMKEGINNCSIINDSYNSDLGSLTIALDFMNQQKQHNKRTIILSDILQSGKNEADLYREVAALLKKKNISRLIGVGLAINRQASSFDIEKIFYATTEDFLRDLNYNSFNSETILIKGARSFGFERISKSLQQKAHETVLEINLNAVVHNLNLFRSRLKPETKLMVMVKAFSYGSGSFEIANILQFHRVDYLAVAYADEGVELRKSGITLPIMVMNPEEQSFDAMISYKLEPDIYSFRILNQFTDALKRRANENNIAKFPVHIEFDTGMHRLGFDESELNMARHEAWIEGGVWMLDECIKFLQKK